MWDRHSRTKLDGLAYTFRSMQNDGVTAARGEKGAVLLAHCAAAIVTFRAVSGQCGASVEHYAGMMDEVRTLSFVSGTRGESQTVSAPG